MKELIAILLGIIASLLMGQALPFLVLSPLMPVLALFYLSAPFSQGIWASALLGAVADFLISQPHGAMPISFVASFFFLYRLRPLFSADSLLHFVLATALFSSLQSLSFLVLLFFLEAPVPATIASAITDWIILPFADALFAFFWYAAPLRIYHLGRSLWKKSALQKQPS